MKSLHFALLVMSTITGFLLLLDLINASASPELLPIYLSSALMRSVLGLEHSVLDAHAGSLSDLVCFTTVCGAVYARYFKYMQGSWATLYAVSISLSVFSAGFWFPMKPVGVSPTPAIQPSVSLEYGSEVVLALAGLGFVLLTTFVVRGVKKAVTKW